MLDAGLGLVKFLVFDFVGLRRSLSLDDLVEGISGKQLFVVDQGPNENAQQSTDDENGQQKNHKPKHF